MATSQKFKLISCVFFVSFCSFCLKGDYLITEFKRLDTYEKIILLTNDVLNFVAFLYGIQMFFKGGNAIEKKEIAIFILATAIFSGIDVYFSFAGIEKEQSRYKEAIETKGVVSDYKKIYGQEKVRYRIRIKYKDFNNFEYNTLYLATSECDLKFPKSSPFEIDVLYDPLFPERFWVKEIPFKDTKKNRIHYFSILPSIIFFSYLFDILVQFRTFERTNKAICLMIPFLIHTSFLLLTGIIDLITIV